MKKVIILDCGPSLNEVTNLYGTSTDWIIDSVPNNNRYIFSYIKSYQNQNF